MNMMLRKPLERKNVGPVEMACLDIGKGESIVFIHGSFDDHNSWDKVADILSRTHRVITYDRRGHSASTDQQGQGSINQDAGDVIGLMNVLQLESAHIVGHSYGANVAISLCELAPSKIKSLFIHEPPIFSLVSGNPELDRLRLSYMGTMSVVADMIEDGRVEEAAELFVNKVAFGEGFWENMFDECARRSILANVDTWLDQFYDPDRLSIDVTALKSIDSRVTISLGTASLPPYEVIAKRIIGMIPNIKLARIVGAGHGAHISHPRQVANELKKHLKTIS